MKKIFLLTLVVLSVYLNGSAQNTLFGHGGYNIQTFKFSWLNGSDSIARIANYGLRIFKPLSIATLSSGASVDTMLVWDYADSTIKKRAVPSVGSASLASTYIGIGDGSNLLSGNSAYTYDGTTVQQINSGAVSKVINNASLSATSGGAQALYTYNTPTASTDQVGIINFGSAGAGSNNYIGASISSFANAAWTGGSSHFGRLVFSTTNSGSATPSEVMRISNGRVSIGTGTTGTAYLTLRSGGSGSNAAPLKFTSGTNQATPEAGTFEYDGTNFYLSPSTTRKRIPLYTDGTPTSGSLLVGNGTDFTLQSTATTFPVQQYTPTYTGLTNITGISTSDLYYQRIGMRVHVWGTVGLDPTSTSTLTEVAFTLPVSSTFANISVLSGSGQSDTIAQGIALKADVANSRGIISFFCVDASNANYFLNFSYEITPP